MQRRQEREGGTGLDDLPENAVVHFKLIEGDTEKDNRKADNKATRAFSLSDPAFEEKEGSLWIYSPIASTPASETSRTNSTPTPSKPWPVPCLTHGNPFAWNRFLFPKPTCTTALAVAGSS